MKYSVSAIERQIQALRPAPGAARRAVATVMTRPVKAAGSMTNIPSQRLTVGPPTPLSRHSVPATA